jgi:serine/threonine protein kinase
MDPDMIGHIIQNRYKLVDGRGHGSFATVYIARALEDNRIYAVKVIHLEHANNREVLARFQREAQILSKLSDSHIVRIFGYGNDNNRPFIVMDYIDGQSLKYYMLKRGPFQPLQALHYTHQIVEGLDIAYRQGVVHRDIKPQNILINSKDVVKITDFGLARSRDTVTLTEQDVFMGTAYYISPEQADNGRLADTRSDLYSVAVVLFEMLTSKPPYEGDTAVEVVVKHRENKIPSICRQRPDLPIEVDRFMEKALAKLPEDRFATPQEFLAALEQLQVCVQAMSPERVVRPSTTQPDLKAVVSVREASLVMLSNGQIFPLKKALMLVGRQDPTQDIYPDILLPDPDRTLGRKHAHLRNRQGTYTVEDLNARNKTRVNGVVVKPYKERMLQDGDILRFGSVEVRFELR